MKKLAILFLFILCLAIFADGAAAIGISTPYLENNILQISKSSSTLFEITLQNVGEEDVLVKLDYGSDKDMVKVIDYKELYNLPAGSIDNKIIFNITAPFNSLAGDTYDFRFSVAPVKAEAGGTISMLPGISRSIKVQIMKPPRKPFFGQSLIDNGLLWGVLILAAAAYFGYSMMHGGKKRRKK